MSLQVGETALRWLGTDEIDQKCPEGQPLLNKTLQSASEMELWTEKIVRGAKVHIQDCSAG